VKLFWRQTPPFPIPSGCRFGSGGHGEQGGRWPAYISLLILVDLDRLPKPIGLCGSCLLGGGVSGWRPSSEALATLALYSTRVVTPGKPKP
jgi:hypothetical protein